MTVKIILCFALLLALLIPMCHDDSEHQQIARTLTLTDENSHKTWAQCRLDDELLHDRPRYEIQYDESISAESAASFFCRVVRQVAQDSSEPFVITYRLCDCPKWGEEYYYFCQKLLTKQGLSIAHDDIEYKKERDAYQQYIKKLLNTHNLPDNRLEFVVIDDFYIDHRADAPHPIILGDVRAYFTPIHDAPTK